MSKIPCSVEILTRNSALTLERCLESVKDFAEIMVLDGNSTDATRTIAQEYGCRIIKQYDTDDPNVAVKDYAEVRNKGLRLATYDWFMFIDSDEFLSSEAVEEIRKIVTASDPPAYVFWQPRKYVLNGKIIHCATTYPNKQIRLFHRAYVEEFIKPIHERIKVKPDSSVGTLKNFEYVPLVTLPELKARWQRYMDTEIKMNAGRSRGKLFALALRNFLLFGLYLLRYLRDLSMCWGRRMPLSFEWTRHKYLLILAYKLVTLKNDIPKALL